jgi:hypothetical protein
MFAFVTGPEYLLPFETFVVHQFRHIHTHRDYAGFSWKEPMQLSISVPAMSMDAVVPANNDNQKAA